MTLQTQFENFLGGREAAGSPIPKLDASVGRKLLGRIDQLQWHLNRYSVELNYLHAALGIDEFLSLARSAGFDGAQFHITRSGPRMGLTAESDQYLAALAEQDGRSISATGFCGGHSGSRVGDANPRSPHIDGLRKNSYLKRIDAPLDAPKPSLKCWMELNEG